LAHEKDTDLAPGSKDPAALPTSGTKVVGEPSTLVATPSPIAAPLGAESPAPTARSIDQVRASYRLQLARYERTAVVVAERLAVELRNQSVRHLLSFRAKHPDDLVGKLERKGGTGKYDRIGENLNEVVQDLAGVRVVVYDPIDERKVAELVRTMFAPAPGPANEVDFAKPAFGERTPGATAYQASHLIVLAPDDDGLASVQGACCEIQICNVAAHLFNELEHDINYKKHHGHPSTRTLSELERLRLACRQLELDVIQLLKSHGQDARGQLEELSTAEGLKRGLETAADRPLIGDFQGLFRLLSSLLQPLTIGAIEKHGAIGALLDQGRAWAASHQLGGPVDDVLALTLGLLPGYRLEFPRQVRAWDAPLAPLAEAILAASAKIET
jgi:ppGpp synthetase/RelA/SpoT-type nucleotidyltranferase